MTTFRLPWKSFYLPRYLSSFTALLASSQIRSNWMLGEEHPITFKAHWALWKDRGRCHQKKRHMTLSGSQSSPVKGEHYILHKVVMRITWDLSEKTSVKSTSRLMLLCVPEAVPGTLTHHHKGHTGTKHTSSQGGSTIYMLTTSTLTSQMRLQPIVGIA